MKSIKLFETSTDKANTIYSVFNSCSVFIITDDTAVRPLYDFSGNDVRSTENSLRKLFPDCRLSFFCKNSIECKKELSLSHSLTFTACYIYF